MSCGRLCAFCEVELISTNASLIIDLYVAIIKLVQLKGGFTMLYLSENLKKFRITKNLTQEDISEFLSITPQSVSKWERGESYPDITFLPALANILETSIDSLIGMDIIRSEQTRYIFIKQQMNFKKMAIMNLLNKFIETPC